jgi:DNA-binding XRE family transcriptional regulator
MNLKIEDRIRGVRRALGLDPKQLSRLLDVTSQAVRAWERGESSPRLETWLRIEALEEEVRRKREADAAAETEGEEEKR